MKQKTITKLLVICLAVGFCLLLIAVIYYKYIFPLFSGTPLVPLSIHWLFSTCTSGWKITGYFIPYEREYRTDRTIPVLLDNGSSFKFKETFIQKVNDEGIGITSDGHYLTHRKQDPFYSLYNKSDVVTTSSGLPLTIGIAAITSGTKDMNSGTIPFGTLLLVPTAPQPWNQTVLKAGDTGSWSDKHVDIFTGLGIKAEKETLRITHYNATVCSN